MDEPIPIKNGDNVNIFYNNPPEEGITSFYPTTVIGFSGFVLSTDVPYYTYQINSLTWGGTAQANKYTVSGNTYINTGDYIGLVINAHQGTVYLATGPETGKIDAVVYTNDSYSSNGRDSQYSVWNITDTNKNGLLNPTSSSNKPRTFNNAGATLYYNTNYYVQSTGKAVGKNETYFWIQGPTIANSKPGYDVLGITSVPMLFYFSPAGTTPIPPGPPPSPSPSSDTFLDLPYWAWIAIGVGVIFLIIIILALIIYLSTRGSKSTFTL